MRPRIQERPRDRLTDKEVEAVVAVPEPHGWVVRLARTTGLRWVELAKVQAADVDQGMLVVHGTRSG